MRTITEQIIQSDLPKWILWWIGTLIFMAGLVAHIRFDQDYLEYPLTVLMFLLLIFYFRSNSKRSDNSVSSRTK